eukprot:3423286-Pyramimonas_sp.AAC.1
MHGLCLLGEQIPEDITSDVVAFLALCQDPEGGYGGGPKQIAHLASTYAAVCTLLTLGTDEAFASVNRYMPPTYVVSAVRPKPYSTVSLKGCSSESCPLSRRCSACTTTKGKHVVTSPQNERPANLTCSAVVLHSESIRRYILRMKVPPSDPVYGGGFRMHPTGEVDIRGTYTAIAVSKKSVTRRFCEERIVT